MDRVRDYLGFIVWLLGLGYIAALPVLLPDSGWVAGAPWCEGLTPGARSWLCAGAEPHRLAPGLHFLGMIAALAVLLQLPFVVLRAHRRRRQARSPSRPLLRRRHKPRPVAWVKPRRHFGLRGAPRDLS